MSADEFLRSVEFLCRAKLAPTGIYLEILRNVDIVSLAQNYPAGTSELFPLSANSDLHKSSTLCRNCHAGLYVRICVEVVRYV